MPVDKFAPLSVGASLPARPAPPACPAPRVTSPTRPRRAAPVGLGGLRTRAAGWLVPALGLAGWELTARTGWIDRSLFASPADVVAALREVISDGALAGHLSATVGRVLAGFALGTAAATVAGIITGTWIWPRRLLDPALQSIRNVPSLAWVPLFVLWLGIGEAPKIGLIALGCFFPVYLALSTAIRDVDRKLVEVGLAYRHKGWRLVRSVYLPVTLPSYHVGLRAGLGLGWMFVVAAEIMGASRGVGYLLVDGQATGRPAIMMASILLFAVLGKLTDTVLLLAGARRLAWQDTRPVASVTRPR